MISSRTIISHILPCAEYSANNAFNYNGNNGKLNNNNKNNTYSCRGLLELGGLHAYLESLPFPLSEFYSIYRKTKKNKASKPSHLIFQLYYPQELRRLCMEVNMREYRPTTSIAFVITHPKTREVIAADFRDRVVQTLLVQEMLPHLEAYEHPHSYSCRVGKGCLAAVQRLQELNEKYRDGYVCFVDLANHFMSIDTEFWTPKVQAFIDEHYDAGDRCEILKFLAQAIYLHRPQDDCIRKSPLWMWNAIPPKKSLFHSETGTPIGNVTSQTLSNFITTGYLNLVEAAGFEFAFYTDDNGIFTFDKEKLLAYLPIFRDYLWKEAHLRLHPDKFYLQECRKGFNAFGFRIKGNNITPSKRIVHNFKRLVDYLLKIAEEDVRNIYIYRDKAQARLNSYLGLLGWSHSYNLRKTQMIRLQNSKWRQIFRFGANFHKVTIKTTKTRRAYFLRQNAIRKRHSLQISLAI